MDNYEWRLWAKVVAYVDMVIHAIDLLVVIALTIVSASASAAVNDPSVMAQFDQLDASNKAQAQSIVNAAMWVMWTFVGVLALITGVQMWAALRLLSASEIGKEPKEALGNARIWRNVTIIFLVFIFIGVFVMPIWLGVVVLLWRVGVLFVVYKFMQELEYVVTSGATNNYPVNVIVKQ